MKAENYIMGIDGGGTKTIALAAGTDGWVYGESQGDSINYNAIGMEKARVNMKSVLRDLEKSTGISRFRAVCIGSSAIFYTPVGTQYKEFLNDMFQSDNVYMLGDIQIAMESMLSPPPYALAISGTGSIVAACDENQNIQHAGGWGYLLGDEGSAYRIAIDGIKAAISYYDGLGEETALTDEVMSYFQIQDMRSLVEKIYHSNASHSYLSSFATNVTRCAEAGDHAACYAVVVNSHKLADHAVALLKKYDNQTTIPLAVSGGVFMNSKLFFESFAARIHSQLNNIQINKLEYPPQVGALIHCLKRMGLPITKEFLQNIRKSYPAVQGEING